MHQLIRVILVLVVLCGVQGQWGVEYLSQGRNGLAGAAAGTKVLFAGGFYFNSSLPFFHSSTVDIFDITTGTWSTGRLSQGRSEFAAAAAGGKVVFAGGFTDPGVTPSSVVDIYDTATGNWSTWSLSQARGYLAAAVVGNKIFFAGGSNNVTGEMAYNAVDIFDVGTNLWNTSSLPVPRARLAGAGAPGTTKVAFAGGLLSGNVASAAVDIYDIGTSSWTTQSLSQARCDLAAVGLGTKVFFAGGLNNSTTYATVDVLDLTNANHTTLSMSQSRADLAAGTSGSKVLFGGGGSNNNVVDIYDLITGNWTSITLASPGRTYLAGTSLQNRTFFAGGTNFATVPASFSAVVDIFDPVTFVLSSTSTGSTFARISSLTTGSTADSTTSTSYTTTTTSLVVSLTGTTFTSAVVSLAAGGGSSSASSSVPPGATNGNSGTISSSSSSSSASSVNAAVIGGAVGGGLGALLLIGTILFLILFCRHRRRKSQGLDSSYPLTTSSTAFALSSIAGLRTIPSDQLQLLNPPIGRGAFGVVRKARFEGHVVAVKTVDLDNREEFEKELTVLSAVPPHPNIVRLMGACFTPEHCLIMEYAENGSLAQLIKDHPEELTVARAQLVLKDVASGMAHLHSQLPPILHRDLKSGNVLIMGDWHAKITDFGMSRAASDSTMTKNVGTARWMAPEVLAEGSGRYSAKADVYSFGIIGWECLAKRVPFENLQFEWQIANAVQGGTRPSLDLVPKTSPPAYVQLVIRCWDANPEQRPAFASIVQDL